MWRRILFVHNHPARFVTTDLALLSEHYAVHEWYQRSQFVNLPLLVDAIRKCDLVFGWFASWHTFWPFTLARILRKPSLLIIGGYDVANMPEIGYGHQRGGLKKWVSRWIIDSATRLVTFSFYSQQEIQQNIAVPSDRIRMAYIGFDDPFYCLPRKSEDKLVLTAGNIDHSNLYRKGHKAFVQAAALLPDLQFVLAGAWRDETALQLRAQASPNLLITGWLEANELLGYYRRASIYVQASQHEGFGMAVAEAMLAGCIPVVTRVGSLPEVVGETGIYINSQTPEAIAAGIQTAMALHTEARAQARQRVLLNFPLETRRAALRSLVGEMLE